MGKLTFVAVALLSLAADTIAKSVADDDIVTINVVHVNDIHAHFEQTNDDGGRCHKYQVSYIS